MEDIAKIDYELTSEYYVNTQWCKSINKAISYINFDEINDFLTRYNMNRNIKEELFDLIDMAERVQGPITEVRKQGIMVYKRNGNWKIEIII